jgi:hypothetical protein
MGFPFELTQESAEELMRALNKAVGQLLPKEGENGKEAKAATDSQDKESPVPKD